MERRHTEITKRLSVDGPDSDGDFELTLLAGNAEWHFISRAEADALIEALGGTPPSPDSPPVEGA